MTNYDQLISQRKCTLIHTVLNLGGDVEGLEEAFEEDLQKAQTFPSDEEIRQMIFGTDFPEYPRTCEKLNESFPDGEE
jgi:hypothetical protein